MPPGSHEVSQHHFQMHFRKAIMAYTVLTSFDRNLPSLTSVVQFFIAQIINESRTYHDPAVYHVSKNRLMVLYFLNLTDGVTLHRTHHSRSQQFDAPALRPILRPRDLIIASFYFSFFLILIHLISYESIFLESPLFPYIDVLCFCRVVVFFH